MRGFYTGTGYAPFVAASELAVKTNFEMMDEEFTKCVVYLDPEEFHTTWLGNKAIYRTRMAMATGGELIVLAPCEYPSLFRTTDYHCMSIHIHFI